MKHKTYYKKRIAVISQDREVSTFFELEALACGCSVDMFSDPPQEVSDFDLVVIDLRVGYCFSPTDTCQIAAVCVGDKTVDKSHFDYVWKWPLSVETLREAYEGISAVETEPSKISFEKPTIYFLLKEPHTVVYRNQTLSLTGSEWQVLSLLADRHGEAVHRSEIAALFEGTQGNLADVHICHLRKKLETPFGIRLIDTMRGKGYCLKANAVYLS